MASGSRHSGIVGLALVVAVLGACALPPPPKKPVVKPPVTAATTTTVKAPATTQAPGTTQPPVVTPTPDGMTFLAGKPTAAGYNNDASRTIISGDGNFVVYHHKSINLVIQNPVKAGCPRPAATDSQVYETDLTNNRTWLVSKGTDGCYANSESTFPFTNEDGSIVVFMSSASNLIAGDTNGSADIYLAHMNHASGPAGDPQGMTRVSVDSGGNQLHAPSTRPSLSGDGTKVVYNTTASNILPGDTNGQPDCYLYNTVLGPSKIQRISVGDQGQQANGFNFRCDIAGNGSAVVWVSDATNLITGTGLGTAKRSVYVRDLVKNTTELASKNFKGRLPVADLYEVGDQCGRTLRRLPVFGD